ncbi:MAG: protein deglycase HchA [Oceanospirillaceae bacterium]|nr:protein deglycase HchA [Oceanospirillaceae bacterium]|tara:strand:+ start:3037 stop:3930 length:894 start_codon:yes stop_codon:yes gene_type:complete
MAPIKKLLGIAPKPQTDGTLSPSPVALKLATRNKTDYDHRDYPDACSGSDCRVLVMCTEENSMTMKNGKAFSTGNHPVETLVPMLHLEKAGFSLDICTPTGKPAQIEMWAMPEKDEAVVSMYQKYQAAFQQPLSLHEVVAAGLTDDSPYVAVFIPGGHGAMLGLPDNKDLGTLLRWVHQQSRFLLAICHGPAALLSARTDDDSPFIYRGYKIAAFPDSLDKVTPLFGYLPGPMPWFFGEKLKTCGVDIINHKAAGVCYQDRKLITGDSPDAANKFGVMAAEALLDALTQKKIQNLKS